MNMHGALPSTHRHDGFHNRLPSPRACERFSDLPVISTSRRVQYAMGYIALGLIDQASDELEAVAFEDRFAPEVMAARLDLHTAAGHWDIVANFARRLLDLDKSDTCAWVALGCAVRRLESIEAARDLLASIADAEGATCATIQYNLACYLCLTGDIDGAKSRLAKACALNARFKEAGLDDPDLQRLWSHIAEMK